MWLPQAEPHFPPDKDEQAVYAIRALASGAANAGQQQLAWRYIMYVTGVSDEFNDMSYRPKDHDATIFAEGKRFVGLMLRKMLRSEFTPKPKDSAPPPTIQKRLKKRALQRTA